MIMSAQPVILVCIVIHLALPPLLESVMLVITATLLLSGNNGLLECLSLSYSAFNNNNLMTDYRSNPVNETWGYLCPNGYYCPQGTTYPIGCAAGTYLPSTGIKYMYHK